MLRAKPGAPCRPWLQALLSPQHGPSTVPADPAGCQHSEQNSGIPSHLRLFMKEITFLEAFQITALNRRKIYLKHIGKTPEDGTELVNIDEREETGLLCRGLSPHISLLQPAAYTWGSVAPSYRHYTQNQSWRCSGAAELPQVALASWHPLQGQWLPLGHAAQSHRKSRSSLPCPSLALIIMWVNVTVCSKLQRCCLGLKPGLLVQSCRPGWC